MSEQPPDAVASDAAMRRRLNRGLPVALVAAVCASALYVNISGNTVFKPTTSVSPPPLAPDGPAVPPLQPYRLSDAGALAGPDNAAVPIVGDVQGHIDQVAIEGAVVTIVGWAVDATARKPASQVIVVLNGQAVSNGVPSVARPDVAAALKAASLEKSGYSVRFTMPPDASPASARVRLFALRKDGAAHELVYPDGYPFKRD